MNAQHPYQRVSLAIDYIQQHFKTQPSLDEVAAHVHLSPHHFQRLFTDWAGVSPKKFLQYVTLAHAKQLLKTEQLSVLDAAFDTGLSSASRLHDLFVHIEGMSPGEYKNGGAQLRIDYAFAPSPFGEVLVANTDVGVCHMAFVDDPVTALARLQSRFPNAQFQERRTAAQDDATAIFQLDWRDPQQLPQIKLHLKGTAFQLRVWQTLLNIPSGELTTYSDIAQHTDHPKAVRAVGTAIGANPIAFIIPCHRVIQQSGALGGYRWGTTRKTALIAWEQAQHDTSET